MQSIRSLFAVVTLAACGASSLGAQASPGNERPVWPDEGPRHWAPRPTVDDITADDLRTRLYLIADDSMRGRRIGEPGNHATTEYIAAEFKRLGLKPAGEGGGYFQALPFGTMGVDGATARLAVRNNTLRGRAEWVPMAPSAANGLRGSAAVRNVATVYAGKWGDTIALDPRMFRGKVAVFLGDIAPAGAAVGAPTSLPSCADVPNKFGAANAATVEAAARAAAANRPAPALPVNAGGVRDRRAEAAGAVGVLVIGLDGMSAAAINAAMNGRAMLQPAEIPGASARLPGATISSAAAQRIFGRSVDRLTVGVGGAPVTASWDYAWRPAASPARNVIAVLPGSDPARAAEYVLVGAHNDHVGVSPTPVDHDSLRAVNTVTRPQGANDPACRPTADQQRRIDSLIAHARSIRPPRADSIFNGADDDGSGTVVLLEIAERFVKEKPARSIVFISHQGEEAGLLGSRWFVEHPTIPLDKIVAAHNMDMVGKGRVDQVKFGGPTSVQTLGAR
ncbi:MAG TPA: M28 family peptidase, partial [Gemmatimonadaceae bacterium]|nr:M28 family peptidase [Gemmatimonadaceae bacterium]